MDDGLKAALEQALTRGPGSNAALDQILADYVRYHLVLAVVGTALLVGVAVLAWWSASRSRAAARATGRRWSLERFALLGVSIGSTLVAAMLAVVVAANVSTVVAPERGFEGAVAAVVDARPGTHRADVQQAYAAWLTARATHAPDVVDAAVADRLSWQAPKAAVTTVLLLLASWWLVRVVRRMSTSVPRDGWAGLRGLAALGASTTTAFVLMLMVMGNTQAAVAPVAITMFLG